MECPICSKDLTPLDVQSRAEHVEVCLENGPSLLSTDSEGRIIIKKDVPESKRRKICPVCDKTFQNIIFHFKTCAIKNDLPLDLMLDHWQKLNENSTKPKDFPPDVLENFVIRCHKDGRVGEQVDLAKTLYLSLTGKELVIQQKSQDNKHDKISSEKFLSLFSQTSSTSGPQISRKTISKPQQEPKKYRVELADSMTKLSNIKLRVERELAASRSFQYSFGAVAQDSENDFDLCLEATNLCLVRRARLKSCLNSTKCLQAECENHDYQFIIEDFRKFIATTFSDKLEPKTLNQVNT